MKIGVQRLPQGFPKKIFAAALVVSPDEKCARPRAAAEKNVANATFFRVAGKACGFAGNAGRLRRREDAHFFIGRRRDFLRATFFALSIPLPQKKQAPLNFSISQRQVKPVAGHAHRTVVQRAKPLSVICIVINTQKRRQNIRSVQQFFLRQNNPVRKCPLKAFKGQ